MSADAPSQAHGQAQKPTTQEQNCPRACLVPTLQGHTLPRWTQTKYLKNQDKGRTYNSGFCGSKAGRSNFRCLHRCTLVRAWQNSVGLLVVNLYFYFFIGLQFRAGQTTKPCLHKALFVICHQGAEDYEQRMFAYAMEAQKASGRNEMEIRDPRFSFQQLIKQ